MTNGEFIRSQLVAFGVSDADLAGYVDARMLGRELDVTSAEKAMIPLLETLLMKPYRKSINESGFSVSWDMSGLGWWYRRLCSKYGIKPDDEVLNAMGLSVIKDATRKW